MISFVSDVEVVGVEQGADVLVGQEPGVRGVARLLEAVGLGRDDRVDEPELVDEEDRAAGTRDPRELGDDELRAPGVMQDPHAARDVERSVLELQGGRVADEELAVRWRDLVARCDEVDREVDADDVLDEGRQRERERTGSAAAVERPLAAVERRQELLNAILERRRAPFLARQAISDHVTHRRPHAPLGWPARRSRRRSHTGSCLKPARAPRSAPRRRST